MNGIAFIEHLEESQHIVTTQQLLAFSVPIVYPVFSSYMYDINISIYH